MLVDKLIEPFTSLIYQKTKSLEKKLGYRLKLNNLSLGWINGVVIFDMTPVWKKAGMDATGVNYFTIGHIENGLSSRFNQNSPYYQAWLGGYIVKFPETRNWSIDEHFKLGETDQKNWLSLCGDSDPVADVDYRHYKKIGRLKIGHFSGDLFQGIIWSHSDVGKRKKISIYPLLMAGMAYFINQSNSHLKLNYKNFISRGTSGFLLESFHSICLKGYVAIFEINKTTKAVLYGNGVVFTDKNGQRHDTFKKIGPEILELLKSVEILKT